MRNSLYFINFIVILFTISCKSDFRRNFTKIITNGDKKYWRDYYYNEKGNLINSNSGQFIHITGENIYYNYDWNDTNFTNRFLENNIGRTNSSWCLICDSILVFEHKTYCKIVAFNYHEIKLYLLNSRSFLDDTLILREEQDQATDIKPLPDSLKNFMRE